MRFERNPMAGFNVITGKKTDYVGKVVESGFITITSKDGNFTGTSMNLVLELEDGGEWNESFSCGKNWVFDTPDEVVHLKGKEDFLKSTMYGRFIEKVATLPGGVEILNGLVDKGLDARKAKSWIGFTFHFSEETITFGKDFEPVIKNFPSEIVAYDSPADEVSVDLDEVLKELAANCSDQATFFTQAMSIPAVTTNEVVINKLGGIWATRNS